MQVVPESLTRFVPLSWWTEKGSRKQVSGACPGRSLQWVTVLSKALFLLRIIIMTCVLPHLIWSLVVHRGGRGVTAHRNPTHLFPLSVVRCRTACLECLFGGRGLFWTPKLRWRAPSGGHFIHPPDSKLVLRGQLPVCSICCQWALSGR